MVLLGEKQLIDLDGLIFDGAATYRINPNGDGAPPPEKAYETKEELVEDVLKWAAQHGYSLKTTKTCNRDKRYRYGCVTKGCPFTIWGNYYKRARLYQVKHINNLHNHSNYAPIDEHDPVICNKLVRAYSVELFEQFCKMPNIAKKDVVEMLRNVMNQPTRKVTRLAKALELKVQPRDKLIILKTRNKGKKVLKSEEDQNADMLELSDDTLLGEVLSDDSEPRGTFSSDTEEEPVLRKNFLSKDEKKIQKES